MLGLVPYPVKVEIREGALVAAGALGADGPACPNEAAYLRAELSRLLGTTGGAELAVRLAIDAAIGHAEGYTLDITPAGVALKGGSPAGVFHGCQTLLQLAQVAATATVGEAARLRLPCLHIEDRPRFPWRGMHLDVSRHFFTADEVCRFIDLMAIHKFNRFHWHLTDDQGWRLPVRKYPRLTEIGGFRKATLIGHERTRPRRYDDTPYGGFYTPEDIRRVVAHAAQHHITVVPEIDMPGHMQAAIAAYPDLGCTRDTIAVRCHWGISQHILNPSAKTIRFMQDVLDEVLDLFPSEFIHIGGDEAHKYEWSESRLVQDRMAELGLTGEDKLQSWFIAQMEQFLSGRGRRLIGWDEILEGGLPKGSAVMSWRGTKGGIQAATAGHDVVMTPSSHTYFDHYQHGPEGEPLAIGGMNTLEKVYGFEPIPAELPAEAHHHILGAQGQLWTEYIGTMEYLEYMTYPRACALAEVLWSPAEGRDWKGFAGRMRGHAKVLDGRGVKSGPMPG